MNLLNYLLNPWYFSKQPNISLLQLIQPYKRLKLLPMLTVQQLERHNIFFFKVIEQQTINKVIAYLFLHPCLSRRDCKLSLAGLKCP